MRNPSQAEFLRGINEAFCDSLMKAVNDAHVRAKLDGVDQSVARAMVSSRCVSQGVLLICNHHGIRPNRPLLDKLSEVAIDAVEKELFGEQREPEQRTTE